MKRIITENRLTLLGSDSFALLILSIAGFLRSGLYLTVSEDGKESITSLASDLLGFEGLAIAWILISLLCVISIPLKEFRRVAFSTQVGAHAGMALIIAYRSIETGGSEVYSVGILFGVSAALIFWGIARTGVRPGMVPGPEEIVHDENKTGDDSGGDR